jgi:NAD(P)-dependent dehydrogenase (short-subunit alcohol dehydrogenase family)
MAVSTAIYPSLRGKTVLITGGAEGIAAAAVELFCRQGSKVIFFDIAADSPSKLIDRIKSLGAEDKALPWTVPTFYRCDVTDLNELKAKAQAVLDIHGTVDVLLNSAAAAGAKSRVPSVEVTPDSWDFDINVNLRHVFFLTQAIVPAMQKQGYGSIINMGSISWRIPAVGTPVYMAAKAAIMGLTKTHSKEFGKDGVRVNSVMPGAIATERQIKEVLTPEYRELVMSSQTVQRDLEPKEVANVILFLASDDSSAVTGSSYVVDGGWVSDV